MPWGLVSVELAVCAWILLLLVAELVLPASRHTSRWGIAFTGLVPAIGLLIWQMPSWTGGTFQELFVADPFAGYFKGLFLLTAAVVIVMTRAYHRHLPQHVGAFYMLLFTALLGMIVLTSVNDLLMLFIGLELLTFSLYIMSAYLKTDSRSIEAGMKYLILGSVSSGFLVYGIALLYGATGGTSFPAIRTALASGPIPVTAVAGLLLVLAGLGFKIAAVPFHLWVPDVYEGAPTPVVALLSVGSKMAGVVAVLRVLYGPFLPLQPLWGDLLAVLSAATMLYGNLGAIPQTNIKRLLGYSSIGHTGYLLMGLSTGSIMGMEAVGYYLLAYLFSTLAAFLIVTVATDAVGGEAIEDYSGLSKRSPVLAASFFVALLSLAGVPPLAGFIGKLLVLLAAADSARLWLVAIGAVNVAISLYYYLMVVKRMYLNPPRSASPIQVDPVTSSVLGLLVLGIIIIGTVQQPFLERISLAVRP
jgi:NADH-quinone oxidoreductase subunit N